MIKYGPIAGKAISDAYHNYGTKAADGIRKAYYDYGPEVGAKQLQMLTKNMALKLVMPLERKL
ncbi:MAG: hypothetical protein R2759_13725 [Bacteroidales bacterium]